MSDAGRDDLKQTSPRLDLQAVRSYEIPGGPLAKNLGATTVKILADFQRGSDQDKGYGARR